jgi:predicted kinase
MLYSSQSELISDSQKLLDSLGPLPQPRTRPIFIALSGLPGTGKSYFSQLLAEKLPLVILESDALRKVLFPQPSYSHIESARLFRACYFLIENLLKAGVSLVLDATNLTERYRQKLYNIAETTKARFVLVKMVAPAQVVRKRLKLREKNPLNMSDADWEVYQSMKTEEETIHRRHYVVDSSKDVTPVIDVIIGELTKKRSIHGNQGSKS